MKFHSAKIELPCPKKYFPKFNTVTAPKLCHFACSVLPSTCLPLNHFFYETGGACPYWCFIKRIAKNKKLD
jgi:hypothetical protein